MIELFKEIWSTAKRNKLRTSLTGFAVAWGIFMLIFLLGAGNGLINAQMQQSNKRLANSIQVWGGYTSKAHKGLKEGRRVALNDRDVRITDVNFKQNVEDVGAIVSKDGVTINYGENYVSTQSLVGVYPVNQKLNKREILAGRFVNDIDLEKQRKSLVLSNKQAKELVKNPADIVGKDVKVGNLMFKVVGVCKDDEQQQGTEAFTAYTTLKTIYGIGDEAHSIEFAINNLPTKADNEAFEKSYRAKLNTQHDAAPDDESSIWIWNRYIDNIQMTTGIGIIRTALWVIGLFTLLSGIVGVSNIMLITVKERTKEFGVRKAIGAKPWQILKLIITESVITTAIFGYIGMLCGIAANEYMDATLGHEVIDTGLFHATMFVDPTVGLDVCIQATMVIIIAGTIAGLIPALKAARVRPIEALRAE